MLCTCVPGAMSLQAELAAARCGAVDLCPAGSHTGLELCENSMGSNEFLV